MEKEIKVIYKKPMETPKVIKIENSLKALQDAVGGYIETVPMPQYEGALIICNEEGKLLGMQKNIAIQDGGRFDLIRGPVVVAWADGEDFGSVPSGSTMLSVKLALENMEVM